MATFPLKTGISNLVNIDLTNTLDFHIATTNHIKVLNDYANDIAAYYVYNYAKQTGDPITSQVNFFLSLNQNELKLDTDIRGAYNPKVFEDNAIAYKLTKLNTFLKPTEVWIVDDDGLPERNSISDFVAASAFHAFDLATNEHRWYEMTEDINKQVKDGLNKLEEKFGVENMDLEILNYWYDKFQSSHHKVKEEYKKAIKEFNVDPLDDTFKDLGDSIGSLCRISESTNPLDVHILLDVAFDGNSGPVSTLPPSIEDKLTRFSSEFDAEITERTNVLFRSHIKRIMESFGVQDLSHQQNLMPDYSHIRRVAASAQKLNGIVAASIGSSYELLFYMKNAQNKQKSPSPIIETLIERNIVKVDLLKNKIQSINKNVGNDILKPRNTEAIDQS